MWEMHGPAVVLEKMISCRSEPEQSQTQPGVEKTQVLLLCVRMSYKTREAVLPLAQ